MPRRRAIACLLSGVLVSAIGCAGSAGDRVEHAKAEQAPPLAKTPAAPPAPEAVEAPPAPPPAEQAPPAPSAEEGPPPVPGELPDAVLPPDLDAGDIQRPTLLAVLAGGVGRFLQNVQLQAQLERGRFIGWRVVALFERRPELKQYSVLRPGDTVLRVNGQSIERPEQFKNVWDSLATESQLVFQVTRGGKHSQIRYRIVD